MTDIHTSDGAKILAGFLNEQVVQMVNAESMVSQSEIYKLSKLHALYASIIEDATSIRLLGDFSKLNQAYIISRALLERITNFCFLQFCTDEEFSNYVDYALNKAGRRLDRSISAQGKERARVALNGGDFELPPEIAAAVAKFTGKKGGEHTRWSKVRLEDRAAVIEAKLGGTGLFMSLLSIYADASEALHGTLYGAVFHLGAFDVGSVPHDQASLDRHRYGTLSSLYLMAGGAIHTLFSVLKEVDEPKFGKVAKESDDRFKKVAILTNLVKVKQERGR